MNYGNINNQNSAGIVGKNCGLLQQSAAEINVTRCQNSGKISGELSAGIVGNLLNKDGSGVVFISSCVNTGDLSSNYVAGILGKSAGETMNYGSIIISDCCNNGLFLNDNTYGIVGGYLMAEAINGTCKIENCNNNVEISADFCSGVVGDNCGEYISNGVTIDISNCKNYGNLTGRNLAGIVGEKCGYLSKLGSEITIKNCDNSCNSIGGQNCGGIVGNNLGEGTYGSINVLYCTNYANLNDANSSGIVANTCGKSMNASGVINIKTSLNKGNINYNYCSGIVGHNCGELADGRITIENCDNSCNSMGQNCGGIVNYDIGNTSKTIIIDISNCKNYAGINNNDSGGIVGTNGAKDMSGNVNIIKCVNYGDLSGLSVGGIIGAYYGNSNTYKEGKTTIVECENNGMFTSGAEYSGGIIGGYFGNTTDFGCIMDVSGCINHSEIISNYSGGIAGGYFTPNNTTTIENCTNNGDITSNRSGGFFGDSFAQNNKVLIEIENCTNNGDISGDEHCGGFAPSQSLNSQTTEGRVNVINCKNYGVLNNSNVGGFFGESLHESGEGTIDISNCVNYGNLAGVASAGIVGPYLGKSQKNDAKITIKKCDNSGSFLEKETAGIAGKFLGQDASGIIEIINCKNHSDIFTENSAGIIGSNMTIFNDATVLIQTCINEGIVDASSGGIVGHSCSNTSAVATITISQCDNSGAWIGANSGGIASFNLNTQGTGSIILNTCRNYADISGVGSGGIVGKNAGINQKPESVIIIQDCCNNGVLKANYCGGIVGHHCMGEDSSGTLNINNCINNGYFENYITGAGGIVGAFAGDGSTNSDISIYYSHNVDSSIDGTHCGGIVGAYCSAKLEISECTNNIYSPLRGTSCGGIVGPYCNNFANNTLIVDKCYNYGDIIASSTNSGGILGPYAGYKQSETGVIYVKDSENQCNLNASGCGGIAGAYLGNDSSGNVIIFMSQSSDFAITGDGAGGIVGTECGNNLHSCGSITIDSCINANVVDLSSTAGIIGSNVGNSAEIGKLGSYKMIMTSGDNITYYYTDYSANTLINEHTTISSDIGHYACSVIVKNILYVFGEMGSFKYDGTTLTVIDSINDTFIGANAVYDGFRYILVFAGNINGTLNDSVYFYDYINPTHSYFETLNYTPRQYASAVNYNFIYLIGGNDGTGCTDKVQYLNNTWVDTHELPEPRSNHTSVVYKNRIYVIGGKTNTGSIENSVIWFDNATTSGGLYWNPAEPLTTPRYDHSSTVFNGKIYVIGGKSEEDESLLNTMEIYNGDYWETVDIEMYVYGATLNTILPTIYINKCINDGTINANGAGGIVAQYTGMVLPEGYTFLIENCKNTGEITEYMSAGGIAGKYLNTRSVANVIVSNCENSTTGSIVGNSGIVADYCNQDSSGNFMLVCCKNSDTVSTYGVGILGNYCNVNSDEEVNFSANVIIDSCKQEGNVEQPLVDASSSNGIIGNFFNFKKTNSNATVENCAVVGDLSGTNVYGIVGTYFNSGSVQSSITIKDCSVTGNIKGGYIYGLGGDYLNKDSTTSHVQINNYEFTGNAITNSGWLYCGIGKELNRDSSGSNITIENCKIIGDLCGNDIYGLVGGLCNYSTNESALTINSCEISGNMTGTTIFGLVGKELNRDSSGSNITIMDCSGKGNIDGTSIYGLIGTSLNAYTHNTQATIGMCNFNGDISGLNSYGVIGDGCNQYSTGSNVTVENCNMTGNLNGEYLYGVIGHGCNRYSIGSNVTVENCNMTGNLNGQYLYGVIGTESFGAPSAFNSNSTNCVADVSGCKMIGNLTGNNIYGIIGEEANYGSNGSTINVTNCDVSGNLTGNTICGIVGPYCNTLSTGTVEISKCNAKCNIINTIEPYTTGDRPTSCGILGNYCNKDATSEAIVNVHDCSHIGDLQGIYISGVIGDLFNSQSTGAHAHVTSCSHTGDISGSHISGIIGSYSGGNMDISACYTFGNITGYSNTGIVGDYCNASCNGSEINISHCNYTGNTLFSFEGTQPIGGNSGIVGKYLNFTASNSNVLVDECQMTGNLRSNYDDLNFTFDTEQDDIYELINAGILGTNANYNGSNNVVQIKNSNHVGDISGLFINGIAGTTNTLAVNSDVLIEMCDHTGQISGRFTSGIVGPCGIGQDISSTVLVELCETSGNILNAYSAGIITFNYDDNQIPIGGKIDISACINNGDLNGNLANSTYDYVTIVEGDEFSASSGICSSLAGPFAEDAIFNIYRCENNGNLNEPNTSGIVGIGIGISNIDENNMGAINLLECINYGHLNASKTSGICSGLIGIDSSGTITFNGCINYGEFRNNNQSGIIHTLGTGILVMGQETNGTIKIIDCYNYQGVTSNTFEDTAGIVNTVLLGRDASLNLTINGCTSNGDVNSYIVGSILNVNEAGTTTDGLTNLEITQNNVNFVPNTILTKQFGLVENIIFDPCSNILGSNIFISENNIVYEGDIENSNECEIIPFVNLINNGPVKIDSNHVAISNIINKTVLCINNITNESLTEIVTDVKSNEITINNIYNSTYESYRQLFFINKIEGRNHLLNIDENAISYNTLETVTESNLIHLIENVIDTTITIENNNIKYDGLLNCNNISGIFGPRINTVVSSEIIANNNSITIDNIDAESNMITGIQIIDTSDDIKTLNNCEELNFTITNNTILTNSDNRLINPDRCNSSIFSTNTDINPDYSLYSPTSTLTLTGNKLIPYKLKYKRNVYYSDNYLPSVFRPYIFKLPSEYPGSNYWWDTVNTDINPAMIDYVIPGRGGTDDTALRQIFKRAIMAINEQRSFEIYPFYQIKVKGVRS